MTSLFDREVTAGFTKAFSPGGAVAQAFKKMVDEELAPLREEMKRLRKIERRHQWHPIEKMPAWGKDGRAMLVSERGEMFWASWVSEPGEEPYWDRDLEYGGSCCAPTDFFLLPDAPIRNESAKYPS